MTPAIPPDPTPPTGVTPAIPPDPTPPTGIHQHIPPPDRPSAPPATATDSWDARRSEAAQAWKDASLAAAREVSQGWTPTEQREVEAITAAFVDRLGEVRRQVADGSATPSALRAASTEAREAADMALRDAIGDRADLVWGALYRASAPMEGR